MDACKPRQSCNLSKIISSFDRTYVDQDTSKELNLTYAFRDTFILRTDAKTVLDPSGPGRNSVRIMSKNQYTSHIAMCVLHGLSPKCIPS